MLKTRTNLGRKYSARLFFVIFLSLLVSACDGGSSSNSSSDDNNNNQSNVECSDGFGDASRCEAREGL
ncbi:hypothetical protein IQ238_23215 [Pleurocapsales cyanobacterium LEGE 06147]|nr:hypothetical protein [Pleurocapsales cyanobacterium LEGE 06147]